MPDDTIEQVAVLGAGSMGHGIAEVAALAGYAVSLRDIEEELVSEGYDQIQWSLEKLGEKDRLDESPDTVLDRVTPLVDLEEAVTDADLVIEAAPESLEIKHDIFREVKSYVDDETILASNTSSLPITDIAAVCDRPERVCGLHFFNPPVKMNLVEVIYGEETSDDTAERAHAWVESIDKTPIYVRKDVRGFVVNTVLGPFGDEAAWMVSAGEATIQEVDAAMVHERGYSMGPFELSDMTGIDVGYHVRTEAGDPVPPIVEEKVEANELGRKTGVGYYDYDDGEGPDYQPGDGEGFDTLRIEARMVNRAAYLVGEGVTTPEEVDIGVRLGLGFPEGICRRADRIGLDTILEKLETLQEATGEDRFEPHPYLVELVEEGKTGEAAGAGFHEYDTDEDTLEYRTLNASLAEGVLAIELDRPERLNALSGDLMSEIQDALQSVDLDDVRCVTLEGAGDRAFCAGADVSSFGGRKPTDSLGENSVFDTVADFPRPVIALIDGFCLGGGLELALACDLRIATDRSSFGTPEIDLGLIPGGGGTQRLMRILGETRAKELVFRGEHIDADRAEDWGLINRAVPHDEFDELAETFVGDIREGPPIALTMAKRVMDEGADASLEAALTLERQGFGLLTTTDDMMEGVAAFAEDRDPEFEGK